jgi:hypothetical protein
MLTIVSLLLLPTLASGQSLVDAAKKEKERRQQVEQANGGKAKSYTQESVESAPPLANDPNIAPAVPLGGSPSSRPSAGAGSANTAWRDSAWRTTINAARQRVEAARKEYERWQSYTLVPGYVLKNRSTGQTVVPTIEALQARTRAAKERLEAAERAVAELEEQARRANITPGALR